MQVGWDPFVCTLGGRPELYWEVCYEYGFYFEKTFCVFLKNEGGCQGNTGPYWLRITKTLSEDGSGVERRESLAVT